MSEFSYGCKTCNDTGAVLVYHRTKPAGPYAFRCHMCGRGTMSRVKDLPTISDSSMKIYANWSAWRAGEEYAKLGGDGKEES